MASKNIKTLDQLLAGRDDLDSDVIIDIMEEQAKCLYEKIVSGRITDPKNEEIRIKQIRSLVYLCKTIADMQKAEKIEELEREIESINEAIEDMRRDQ